MFSGVSEEFMFTGRGGGVEQCILSMSPLRGAFEDLGQ